jgi:hypothetical protein
MASGSGGMRRAYHRSPQPVSPLSHGKVSDSISALAWYCPVGAGAWHFVPRSLLIEKLGRGHPRRSQTRVATFRDGWREPPERCCGGPPVAGVGANPAGHLEDGLISRLPGAVARIKLTADRGGPTGPGTRRRSRRLEIESPRPCGIVVSHHTALATILGIVGAFVATYLGQAGIARTKALA